MVSGLPMQNLQEAILPKAVPPLPLPKHPWEAEGEAGTRTRKLSL